jgi:hypothetical protein
MLQPGASLREIGRGLLCHRSAQAASLYARGMSATPDIRHGLAARWAMNMLRDPRLEHLNCAAAWASRCTVEPPVAWPTATALGVRLPHRLA